MDHKEIKMNKKIIIFIFCILSNFLFATEKIELDKNILGKMNSNSIYAPFHIVDDGIKYAIGPFINEKGELRYCYIERNNSFCLSFANNNFSKESIKVFQYAYDCNLSGQNINGINVSKKKGTFSIIKENTVSLVDDFRGSSLVNKFNLDRDSCARYYPVNKGIVYEDTKLKQFVGIELTENNNTIVIAPEKLNEWLSNQKGNFSIDNNHLLKNGFLWSCEREYFARLRSGHLVSYRQSEEEQQNSFEIITPSGYVELEITVPWYNENLRKPYSWCFGNYGELYSLVGPEWKNYGKCEYNPDSKEDIELVVSRNYLKYFGILNDDRIRLRKGPGTDTESLGTYPIKTGFRILEDSGVRQTIDGKTYTWIKVRLLNETEGYFYGQYVQNLYDGPGTPLPWPNVADWD